VDKDVKLRRTNQTLKSYNGTEIKTYGTSLLNCKRNSQSMDLNFFIVEQELTPILGAKSCIDLNLIQVLINHVHLS